MKFSGNIQYVYGDIYSSLKKDDLYVYLNDIEKKEILGIDNDLKSLHRECIVIKSKISKLNKIHTDIYTLGKATVDVIIIGAGIAGLTCANQLMDDKKYKYKSILIIDNEIGGSIALTTNFGMGLLPYFIIDTKAFLNSIENVLTCYNILVWKRRVNKIEWDKGKYTVECDGHFVETFNIVLANGCMCHLYRELLNCSRVLDTVQLSYHKSYFNLIKHKRVGIIYKKRIIDTLDCMSQNINIEITDIVLKDIIFLNDNIYIKTKDVYVDYIIFDRSVFEINRIEGEEIVPKEFNCGDRNGKMGVLNAINTGINVGKNLINAENARSVREI